MNQHEIPHQLAHVVSPQFRRVFQRENRRVPVFVVQIENVETVKNVAFGIEIFDNRVFVDIEVRNCFRSSSENENFIVEINRRMTVAIRNDFVLFDSFPVKRRQIQFPQLKIRNFARNSSQ